MLKFLKKRKPLSSLEKIDETVELARTMIFQRNLLIILFIIILSFAGFIVSQLYRTTIDRMIKPFIIEEEDRTGIYKVITPVEKEKYATDATITDYHLRYYLTTRESFSSTSYRYNYYTVVKSFSTEKVFDYFSYLIWNNRTHDLAPDQLIHIAEPRDIAIDIESIIPLNSSEHNIPGQVVQIYFTQYPLNDLSYKRRHKMATIGYNFDKSFAKNEQDLRELNPLGFQVLFYELTDVASTK